MNKLLVLRLIRPPQEPHLLRQPHYKPPFIHTAHVQVLACCVDNAPLTSELLHLQRTLRETVLFVSHLSHYYQSGFRYSIHRVPDERQHKTRRSHYLNKYTNPLRDESVRQQTQLAIFLSDPSVAHTVNRGLSTIISASKTASLIILKPS